MPRVQFGITAFERGRGDLPELPVVNMFAEEAATEETGVVLQSRPGLTETSTLGSEPVDALFQKDGVLDGAQFAVSDNKLYEDGVLVGSIDGIGPYFIDGFETRVFVAGGGQLWSYNGTTLAAVSFPDSADVAKVVVGASRAVCLRADTGQFYWTDVLSTTIDALSFATAESQPDQLLDVVFIDDALVLFGRETVEFWPNTGDADLPFQPLEGRVFSKGIKATGAASLVGESFAWVTSDNQVCYGDLDGVLSNAGLEEDIKASASASLWTFNIDAAEFLALRLDTASWVMPIRSRTWHEFVSYQFANWIPQCHAAGVFGSSVDGALMEFATDHVDLGETLERRFRAGFPLNSGGVTVNNVTLRTNPGNTPYLSGDYVEPRVEMRTSRDGGRTWSIWRAVSLGVQGEYRKSVRWLACGQFGQPGFLAEFRVTDPVDWRVSEVLVNEPLGGI